MEQLLLPIDNLIGETVERTLKSVTPEEAWDKMKRGPWTKLPLPNGCWPMLLEKYGQERLPMEGLYFKRENRFVQSVDDLDLLQYAYLPEYVV